MNGARVLAVGLCLSGLLLGGCRKPPVDAPPATTPRAGPVAAEPTGPSYNAKSDSPVVLPEAVPAPSAEELHRLTSGNARFGYRLARVLAAGNSGDVCISPYSLGTAFGMLLAGARGETRERLRETLGFEPTDDEVHVGYAHLQRTLGEPEGTNPGTLRVANSLWLQEGYELLHDFAALTERRYAANATTTSFPDPGRDEINAWTSERTEGKIPQLLPPGSVEGDTRLILVNALYLLASWDTPFRAAATSDKPFRTPAGARAVPTMHRRLSVPYAEGEVAGGSCKAIALPYATRGLDMAIVLPEEGTLPLAADGWDERAISSLLDSARCREVDVALPKWQCDANVGLRKPLSDIGLGPAFEPGADFTGLVRASGEDRAAQPWISDVYHGTSVTVNEEGTEAAAATAIVMTESGDEDPPQPVSFIADHPFLYLIRDTRSGQILFLGRLCEP